MSNTLIIIPAYNEKENIEGLINEIFRHADDVDILVVDDSSPDGTGLIVDNIAKRDSRVSVLHRKSYRGRGNAGIDAFKEALKRDDILYVMEMDADFSHNPEHIPQFIEGIKNNDIVIGSRFIEGGQDIERDFLRKRLSKIVNVFIRKYLRLEIKDCSAGYRCFKRGVIASIDLDSLISKGPAIIEEVLYLSKLKKYKIKEIPIVFKERYEGSTKIGFIKLMKVLIDILFFKYKHLPERENKVLKELRKFGFSIALALNILGFIMFLRGRPHFIWFTGFGSLNLIFAIVSPWVTAPIKKMLDFIIKLIGKIVNTISLVVIFYFIFTPIAIVSKVLGKDLLNRRIDKSLSSYWVKRGKPTFSIESYTHMG